MSLAIFGGAPTSEKEWPAWPRPSRPTLDLVESALLSSRWTVSGQSLEMPRFELQLRSLWAEYIGVKHALPCSSGTAGLALALDALDIGPGDEVIVPGMTWVACPQSVYNSGARPVFADVDSETLSIRLDEIEACLSPATKAILVVHAYAGMADIEAICTMAQRRGLHVIEDASQAHGAAWSGRRAGAFGEISVFSTQQSKLLTSGEGGLVCTDSDELFERLQYARMDGRKTSSTISPDNWMMLEGSGSRQGRNFNLPEFSCALLIGGIQELETLNQERLERLEALEEALSRVGGVRLRQPGARVTRRVAWRATLELDLESFGGLPVSVLGKAVTREVGLPIEQIDKPLNRNPLYQPLRVPRICRRSDASQFDPSEFNLPIANCEWLRTLAFPHLALLAPISQVLLIAEAFERVRDATPALRDWTLKNSGPEASGFED